jgi:hypothetical protein
MGGWEVWAALIVGAAVWIIGQLLRQSADDDPKKRPPARPQPTDRPNRPRPASGTTDLDRFLQEVQRRKQMAEGHGKPPPPPKKPQPQRRPPPRNVPDVLPTRTPGAERWAQPAVVEVVPVQTPPARVPAPAPVQEVVAAVVVPGEVQPMARRAFPPPRKTEMSPALAQLQKLMASRDSLRAAVLLQEVLGPPLCHRHGRR